MGWGVRSPGVEIGLEELPGTFSQSVLPAVAPCMRQRQARSAASHCLSRKRILEAWSFAGSTQGPHRAACLHREGAALCDLGDCQGKEAFPNMLKQAELYLGDGRTRSSLYNKSQAHDRVMSTQTPRSESESDLRYDSGSSFLREAV